MVKIFPFYRYCQYIILYSTGTPTVLYSVYCTGTVFQFFVLYIMEKNIDRCQS